MTKYTAPNDTIERYDADPSFVVVAYRDKPAGHLGGMPSPALIDAGTRGHAVEAWRTDDGYWRLRDPHYDAGAKRPEVEYVEVVVGRPGQYPMPKPPAPEPMKVAVNLTITVDAQAYRDEYGDSHSKADIRDDVKQSVRGLVGVEGAMFPEGTITAVEER